ncbi:hypothetical protein D3C78_1888350 [compost metagenome]
MQRCEEHFDRLWKNTTRTDGRIAADLLDGKFQWLEAGVRDVSEGTGEWIAQWSDGVRKDVRWPYPEDA